MYLKKLSLINFKNLEQAEIFFDAGINCIVGDNGTCKTNIVDAIYYLSMCKSALSMSDGQCVMHGKEFFVADGTYVNSAGRNEVISCSYSRGSQKTVKRNGKAYTRLSEHVGVIPVVLVSPFDSALICDAAEERRRYLNLFISQFDSRYLAALIRYNGVLAERNRLLKMSPDESVLQIYDMQLVESAATIHAIRREVCEVLNDVVARYYAKLSGGNESVGLEYRSELNVTPLEVLLKASRERDIINGFTSSGVHRDDLLFTIDGYPLRKFGSQGQQKSFVVALKLAQCQIIAERCGERPVLLLDDIFDRLDRGRVVELVRTVATEKFGQVVITDCNKERMEQVLSQLDVKYRLMEASHGVVISGYEEDRV